MGCTTSKKANASSARAKEAPLKDGFQPIAVQPGPPVALPRTGSIDGEESTGAASGFPTGSSHNEAAQLDATEEEAAALAELQRIQSDVNEDINENERELLEFVQQSSPEQIRRVQEEQELLDFVSKQTTLQPAGYAQSVIKEEEEQAFARELEEQLERDQKLAKKIAASDATEINERFDHEDLNTITPKNSLQAKDSFIEKSGKQNDMIDQSVSSKDAANLDAERLAEEADAALLEAGRLANEATAWLEAERIEKDRLDADRLAKDEEAARITADRLAKAESARINAEQLAREQQETRLKTELLAQEQEAARLEVERETGEEAGAGLESERLALEEEATRLEADQLANEELERVAREEAAQLEVERLAKEEAVRIEAERADAERKARALKASRLEAEILAAEELERLEAERIAREQEERVRMEAERLSQEQEFVRLEAERLARENETARLEAERIAREEEIARLETERLAKEESERLAREAARFEAERLAQEEAERIAREKEAARVEAARLANEETARIEAERLANEEAARIEAERLAKLEATRLEAERLAREEEARLEAERWALEEEAARVEAERLAKEELERLAREEEARLEAERIACEEEEARLEAERSAAEEAARLEAERLAQEQEAARMEAERIACEEEAARLEAERKEAERIAQEREDARLEAERLAIEEAARLEAERVVQEREVARIAEAQRVANEEAARKEAERLSAEQAARLEAERIAREEAARVAETERVAYEKEEAARMEATKLVKQQEEEEREGLALAAVVATPALISPLVEQNSNDITGSSVSNTLMPDAADGSTDAGFAIALYSFVPDDYEREIELQKGDLVEVLHKPDSEWCYGRTDDGREGLFPSNYVQFVNREKEQEAVQERNDDNNEDAQVETVEISLKEMNNGSTNPPESHSMDQFEEEEEIKFEDQILSDFADSKANASNASKGAESIQASSNAHLEIEEEDEQKQNAVIPPNKQVQEINDNKSEKRSQLEAFYTEADEPMLREMERQKKEKEEREQNKRLMIEEAEEAERQRVKAEVETYERELEALIDPEATAAVEEDEAAIHAAEMARKDAELKEKLEKERIRKQELEEITRANELERKMIEASEAIMKGHEMIEANNAQGAMAIFQQAFQEAQALQDMKLVAQANAGKAAACRISSDIGLKKQAAQLFEGAASMFELINEPALQLDCIREASESYLLVGQRDEAIKCLERFDARTTKSGGQPQFAKRIADLKTAKPAAKKGWFFG